jgi:maleate isomerase
MRQFGVLVPATNTTVEIEYNRLLPPTLQAHVGRIPLLSSGAETGKRENDAEVATQARMLGSAKVEVIGLAQSAASLAADDFDEIIIQRMSEAAGVPAITAGQAIAHALVALGLRRIALVSPVTMPTLERAKRHYENKYGLQVLALECFSGADSVHFASLGPEAARDAMARADRPEIEALVIPGGNFPTMRFVPDWERQFGKPVITANQAALWAMLHVMKVDAKVLGLGRLLEEMPTIRDTRNAS